MDCNLIVILGTTASGKTRLAAHLAKERSAELISADSRQVYRGMDLGTGKDLSEYIVDGVHVPCHLIDIVDPDQEFNVFEYQKRFFQCYEDIHLRGIVPVMAGGTGLYIEAVLQGYEMPEVPENIPLRAELDCLDDRALAARLLVVNPSLHNTTDLLDRKRLTRAIEIAEFRVCQGLDRRKTHPDILPLVIGVRWERAELRRRITRRLKERLDAGMIDEVRCLHDRGISWDNLDYFGLEYRCIGHYLRGRSGYDEMFQTLNTRIHQFAKRQETWFRRMEKRGTVIHWIDAPDDESPRILIDRFLS